ncbi:MAG: DUF6491 family protein [Pseudoxanthomonas sp.]
MDARLMQEVRQSTPLSLLVLGSDGRRFRVELGNECKLALQDADATLLAEEGWVCGRAREFVQTAGQTCRIAAVRGIDAREYAELARISDRQQAIKTLGTVEVRADRRHGFAGSYSYCFSPRHMRSWSEDGESMLVEMSPKRSRGNRYYRVELVQNCPVLDSSPAIYFQSGMGTGLICGNPGDRVVAIAEEGGFSSRGIKTMSCAIGAVYPMEKTKKKD